MCWELGAAEATMVSWRRDVVRKVVLNKLFCDSLKLL